MKKILKSMLFLLAASTGWVLTSCSDDDDLTTADALFRPVITENDNIEHGLDDNQKPYMIVTWDRYTDATEYVITAEANDGSDNQSITTDTTTCTFYNLQYDKEYNVSIRCVNNRTGLQSKDYTLTTTSLDYPTKLLTPSATDVIDVAARISWNGIAYDSIQIVKDSNDSLVTTAVLTDANNTEMNVIVEGLAPKTTYQARAYLNDEYLGKKRFTTTAEESYGDDAVIDLRDLTDAESNKIITAGKIKADIAENPGKNITYVLKGGVQYNISGVSLPAFDKRIKFVTGLTLAGNAIFTPKNFTVDAGIELEAVEFEKINFTSGNDVKTMTAKAFGGNQVFNINSSKSVVKNVTFKSCNISCYRAVVRGQTVDDHINNVVFEDCVIDGIGDQGVVTIADKGGDFQTVKVKNCTLTNIFLFCDLRKTVNPVTIDFENSTLCYVSAENNGTPLIRLGDNTATFTIKNTLIGPSMAGEVTTYTAGSGASPLVDKGSATTFNVESSYKTKFDVKLTNDKVIDGLLECGLTEKELWKDPTKGDYTVVGKLPEAGLGDPRWLE